MSGPASPILPARPASLLLAFGLAVVARGGGLRGSLQSPPGVGHGDEEEDPFLWLEDTGSPEVTEWVLEQNNRTLDTLGIPDPTATPLYREILASIESTAKIPRAAVVGDAVYNFWRDKEHVRGIWRRTTWESYAKTDTEWETVFDLDEYADAEGEPWVWKGCSFLNRGPGSDFELCLMKLSHGGKDAHVVREFNVTSKAFVEAPKGFRLPLAKSDVSYEDDNTLLVGTDFGPGSTTTSGYPRTVRRWTRGAPLSDSELVFEGEATDLVAGMWRDYNRQGFVYEWRARFLDFYERTYELRMLKPSMAEGFRPLSVPKKTKVGAFADQVVLELKEPFAPPGRGNLSFPSGAVVAAPMEAVLSGADASWTTLFTPTANRSMHSIVKTRDAVAMLVLDAVKPLLLVYTYSGDGGWTQAEGLEATEMATMSVSAVDSLSSNRIWLRKESILQPPTMYVAEVGAGPIEAEEVKTTAQRFDPAGLEVSQRWARSKDGTPVPYFLVSHSGETGPRPTILYGYGGFGVSLRPYYMSSVGIGWLTKGGSYAMANIRGGGEFGPEWHQTATQEGRHRSFEDFAAVAEDLVTTGVTTAAQLGASGGSNGGLLVGNMLVQYPERFGAIDCAVPLLDMKRYTHLLAGASWMAEYGDPDKASDWAFLRRYSPYHNVDPSAEYPPVLFTTSSADDRVHPGHARKMTAKIQAENAASANTTLFYESVQGGHANPTLRQYAYGVAVKYSFFGQFLGLDVQATA